MFGCKCQCKFDRSLLLQKNYVFDGKYSKAGCVFFMDLL